MTQFSKDVIIFVLVLGLGVIGLLGLYENIRLAGNHAVEDINTVSIPVLIGHNVAPSDIHGVLKVSKEDYETLMNTPGTWRLLTSRERKE